MTITLQFVSAPCGAGKTFAIQEEAHRSTSVEHRCVLVVQPTVQLIRQTLSEFEVRFPKTAARAIYGKHEEDTPTADIRRHLSEERHPHVLFITQEAFLRLPFFPHRDQWSVLIDEIPQIHKRIVFDEDAPILMGAMQPGEAAYSEPGIRPVSIAPGRKATINGLMKARTKSKHFDKTYEASRILLAEGWQCFTRVDEDNRPTNIVYGLLRPDVFDGFRSVTIIGSNLTDSLLYRKFSADGVVFEENEQMTCRLRYRTHSNGDGLKIYHSKNGKWSKKARNGDGVLNSMVGGIKGLFGDQRFAWSANEDVPDDLFDGCHADRLPHAAHGLNEFDQIDNVAMVGAYRLLPDHQKFLECVAGVSDDDILRSIHAENVYQHAMRGSLRDPNNTNPKRLYVPDKVTADYLGTLFPGSKIEFLECGISHVIEGKPGRPRLHSDEASRVAAHRQREKRIVEETLSISRRFINGEELPPGICNGITLEQRQIVTGTFYGTIFQKEDGGIYGFLPVVTDQQFLTALRKQSKEIVKSKDETLLVSPALFVAELTSDSTFKSRANVLFARNLWFDIDGGDMHPNEFADILQGLKCVSYASYSSTKEQLRYRFVVLTDKAMDAREYLDVHKAIRIEVEKRYPGQTSGIDRTKVGPESHFRWPCRPADPTGAFFKVYQGKGRKPLVVDEWKCRLHEPVVVDLPADRPPGQVNDLRVKAAIDKWRQDGHTPGEGNPLFFKLGLSLRGAGMDLPDIERVLRDEARYANSPEERTQQIRSIMSSLQKYLG